MSLRWFQSLLYSKLTILESSEAYFMNNPWPKELQHFWWCGRHWEGNRKRKGNRRWGTRAKSWGKNSRKFEGLYEVPWRGASWIVTSDPNSLPCGQGGRSASPIPLSGADWRPAALPTVTVPDVPEKSLGNHFTFHSQSFLTPVRLLC